MGSLGFIHGVFFEVLVCVSISMYMIDFYNFLNAHDEYCVYLQFFFAGILIVYLCYVLYFTIFKAGALVEKTRIERLQEEKIQHQITIKKLRESDKRLHQRYT